MVKRVLPRLENFASVRQIKRKIKGSDVIYKNREALASELINIGTANISDVVEWEGGVAKVKDVKDIPEHALSAIKKIRILKDGTLDIEMVDKVRVLQMLAKSAGLLDTENEADRPAVIDIKMVGPTEEKE
jgi:hypothetical protein|tara:strand:- start:695 stop:1087 length:393 start_codon:yes stop_codon:yes gene_type:complete